MKNQYRFLIIFILMVTFFSCQKNDISNTELESKEITDKNFRAPFSFNVEVKNDMLSFPSRIDYDKALEYLGPQDASGFAEWEAKLGFVSMRAIVPEEDRLKNGIFDDLLATLINKDAMIEIAGNVFVLDPINELVSVIPASSFDKSGLTGKSVSTFSTNDNILDILEGKDVRLTTTERASYCDKRKLSWDNGTLFSAKIVYQKAGILNSLQSKLQNGPVNIFNLKIQTSGSNFWRNRKKSGTIPYYSSAFFDKQTKSYRPYYSSRRLKSYRFSMKFIVQDPSYEGTSTGLLSKILTIDCY